MPERQTLLLGSIPAASADEAMTDALRTVGPALRYLPDGETGGRGGWVTGAIENLRAHPGLQVSRKGNFASDAEHPRFSVRKGHQLTSDSLDFGYLAAYRENRPVFDRLREEFHRPDLAFQVGVPSDFDLALRSLGPVGMLRHRRAFSDALLREIEQIHTQAGSEVLFQIEVPTEQVFVAKAPAVPRPLVAAWMSRAVVRLARRAPSGARFGVHLCLGDLRHQAMAKPQSTTALVRLANAVARRWPADRPLDYLHAPLAAGTHPPSLDPDFYRALAGIQLPQDTRFVAGFLHEARTVDELRQILGYVEGNIGRPVDVAAACGLGRLGAEAAHTVMQQGAQLCEAPI